MLFEELLTGVEVELGSFFDRISGRTTEGEEEFGDLSGALRDVAFIEAALKSGGKLVDLTTLPLQV